MIRAMGTASLRQPGATLLVSCYELGHEPLGTAWPAGFLRRAGFQPTQLDLAVDPFDEARVRRAGFIGFSVPMHTALRLGLQAARRARVVNPGAFICCFGLYAVLNRDFLLRTVADAVLGGECEDEIVRLAEAVNRGVAPAAVPEAVRRKLDFPLPERAGLPGAPGYARLLRGGEEIPAAYVEASRGCLHHCLHCPIPPVYRGRFFVVPAEVVLEDIRRQVAAGAGHITFGDPDFLNGPGHSLKLARALHAEFPDVTFDFTAKVEHLLAHRSLLAEFVRLGCAFAVTAVESLSDIVLARLEKGHTRRDVAELVRVARSAGLVLRPSLVAFTPWTTLDDYRDVFEFVDQEGLVDQIDPVQYGIRLLVPPGSALLGKPWLQEHLGELDAEALSYRWVHPDPRMDRLFVDVSALVEGAAAAGEDPRLTFERVRAAALEAQASRRAVLRRPAPLAPAVRSPRLSEPWFC